MIDSIVKHILLKSVRCRVQSRKLLFYFYFSNWCNAWQFHATCEMANWAGISGAWGGVHQFALNSWLTVTVPLCAMQRGQSARETSSHYWSLGRMQEDWNDMLVLVWWMAVPPSDSPSSSTLMEQGIPNLVVWWMLDPPSDPLPRSHLWNVDPASHVYAVK